VNLYTYSIDHGSVGSTTT